MQTIHSPFTIYHLPFIFHFPFTKLAAVWIAENCKLIIGNSLTHSIPYQSLRVNPERFAKGGESNGLKIDNCELKIEGLLDD
ncbi:MAG: hypothetical protein UX30_C0006G0038 [Candidatus Saccharibacteria bacterium GW2011_GWA2_46_10]|nr:MAG: hypothetical protein UX30_C0006G0038 [Candidatus Saccharibacteria bacterium GW2011_GWA2_46_10]OGL35021.1 MAG: hypothetical protein A3F05_01670 [Candidatus Saccharibacteria bacterium RIFCSPHIGHO2_12_FULL_47_17]